MFGDAVFADQDEYQAFRYRFLLVLTFSGAAFTLLFVVGEYLKVNRIPQAHFAAMHVFTTAALVLWWLLRGHPERLRPIAWVYEAACLLEYTSALWFVPTDELRLMWFFVNVPGVFMVLGHRAGWGIVAVTVLILVGSNAFMPVPYSQNALATALVALVYLGVFFHAFSARSISYFKRMRRYNEQLESLASHDALTGVLNTRAYRRACDVQVALARRTGQPYAVLFIDLDHFKKVNDIHGHAAGDAVLKTVARRVASSLRSTDILGRIGGEEFSVFLPSTPREGALRLAENLRQAIEQSEPDIGGLRLKVTASIGVAVCEGAAQEISEIQHSADEAMYRAKAQGRNRVSLFGGASTGSV